MIVLFLAIALIGAITLPSWWVKHTFKKYSKIRDDIPGSGSQFAEHLINKLALDPIKIEEIDTNELADHYDPKAKVVRLSRDNFNNHSLAAMVIAAHEVGHAIQDAQNHPWMRRRELLIHASKAIEIIAPIALTISPILLAVSKSPALSLLVLVIGALSIGLTSLIHLITLPVELDASFNKALPILEQGHYLKQEDLKAAHSILKAAAFTYVAQSLLNLINAGYWLRRLRF